MERAIDEAVGMLYGLLARFIKGSADDAVQAAAGQGAKQTGGGLVPGESRQLLLPGNTIKTPRLTAGDAGEGSFANSVSATTSPPNAVTYEGNIYRSHKEGTDPFYVGEYNISANHRYTDEGTAGSYWSSAQSVSAAEMAHYTTSGVNPMKGKEMSQYSVGLSNMLDLSDSNVRNVLGITGADLVSESYDLTHRLGQYAVENKYSGIIAPSARSTGGVNLIIFDSAKIVFN
jgi:RES domain-containing protein